VEYTASQIGRVKGASEGKKERGSYYTC